MIRLTLAATAWWTFPLPPSELRNQGQASPSSARTQALELSWACINYLAFTQFYTVNRSAKKSIYPFFPAWQVLGRSSFLDLWWGQKSHAPKLTEKTPGGYEVEVTLRNCARAARSLKPKFTSLIKLENQKDKPTQEKCTVYINLLGHGGNEHITIRTHWVAQERQTSNELSL